MVFAELLGDGEQCVSEALAAFASIHSTVVSLWERRVIVQKVKVCGQQVALVSGGGGGHEPAHCGYVGEGMLTAAVTGDVFTSPSAAAVTSAITAAFHLLSHRSDSICVERDSHYIDGAASDLDSVTNTPSVLLIVTNYSADRLNFGSALQRSLALGVRVKMVIISDDCAAISTGDEGIKRPLRGVAGTILVHKITGAAAAAGCDLTFVSCIAENVANNTNTLSLSFTPPSQADSDGNDAAVLHRNDGCDVDIGRGIHGEAGVCRIRGIKSTADAVSVVLDRLLFPENVNAHSDQFVLLVNNLGGLSCLQLQLILAESLHQMTAVRHISVVRVVYGTLMSSLNMTGFSLTLYNLSRSSLQFHRDAHEHQFQLSRLASSMDSQRPASSDCAADFLLQFLDAPTGAVSWPGALKPSDVVFSRDTCVPSNMVVDPCQVLPNQITIENSEVALVSRCLEYGARALVSCQRQLNILDGGGAGDSDCGSTIAKGARLTLHALCTHQLNLSQHGQLLFQLSTVWDSVGGTSGALYSLALAAAATGDNVSWRRRFSAACSAIKQYGGASIGERSMLDAMLAVENTTADGSDVEQLVAAAEAAETAAAATATMVARVGRASHVATTHSTPDPGAHAVGIWMRAFAEAARAHYNCLKYQDSFAS